MIDSRNRVLPDQRLGGHLGSEVPRDRAHVAVRQLEPRTRVRVRERRRVLVEAARDGLVDRVHPQREVGRQHHRSVRERRVLRIRDGVRRRAASGDPLMRAGRALRQLPLVAEERVEVAVVPRDRRRRPGTLEAAGDRLIALAGAEAVGPAEAHLLQRCRLGIGTEVILRRRAVGLAEGVTTGNEGDRLLVVHRHAAERLADVDCGSERIGIAVRALRVHVDQAHLHGRERVLELTIAAVALVVEPDVLVAPVDVLLRLPDVGTSAAEAERLEAHRLHRDVAGEHQEVGPRDLAAVLLLDRPEQAARLVEVGVVRPAVERGEALHARTGATATVLDAVRARCVPGHTHEERAVVPVVGGPPLLRVGHQLHEVGLEGSQVERRELRGVVKVLAHRVGLNGVLVQDPQVQLVGPPIAVRGTTAPHSRDRARAFASHICSSFACVSVVRFRCDRQSASRQPRSSPEHIGGDDVWLLDVS